MEHCTQNFAETTIPVIPVCLDPAKLSLKSGLAEVNIVHLPAAMEGALANAKMRLHEARERR
jgi:hypothetical protein